MRYGFFFIIIIILEKTAERQRASLYLLRNSLWDTVTTILTTPSVISSPGYPFFMTPGMIWRWKIASSKSHQSVGIFILDISFRSYEVGHPILC